MTQPKISVDQIELSTSTGLSLKPSAPPTVTSVGGVLTLTGGDGGSTSGAGGAALLSGGVPTLGAGGGVAVSGAAGVGTNQAGGHLTLTAGAATGSGTGGNVSVTAGASPSGTDGSIVFTTNAIERLEIRGDGGWEVGGSQGTAGNLLASNGMGTPPTWTSYFLKGSTTFDFASIASNTDATTTIAVTGAAVGDPVALGRPTPTGTGAVTELSFEAYVSAVDVVTLNVVNATAGAADLDSATYTVVVFKYANIA